jgi:hypothetical protein
LESGDILLRRLFIDDRFLVKNMVQLIEYFSSYLPDALSRSLMWLLVVQFCGVLDLGEFGVSTDPSSPRNTWVVFLQIDFVSQLAPIANTTHHYKRRCS